jgi:hypothetical protein
VPRTLTATHPLRIHQAVMDAAGPQALAAITADLTPEDERLVDEFLADIAGLDDEQAALRFNIPAGMVPQFRRLKASETIR